MSDRDDINYTTKLPGDVAYTATLNDYLVSYQGITAGRTLTLPAPSAALTGRLFFVQKDAAAFAVTITPASGTIDGAANVTLAASAVHGRIVFCDGVTYWTLSSF